jgi:hypothetical protein
LAKYAGRKGVAYLSTTGGGAATTVLGLNEWSLNMPTDKYDVTEFGDANKTYVQGLPDVTGTLSGFWDDTDDNLYDGAQSADGIKMYLYPSSDAASKYWYGTAWTDFSITVPQTGPVAVSGSFSAAGAWGQK